VTSSVVAIDYLREHGPSRAVEIGQALADAGLVGPRRPPVQAGTDTMRRLMRAGVVERVGRGVYELAIQDSDEVVGMPGAGSLTAADLAGLRDAVSAYAAVLEAAIPAASPGLAERLRGESDAADELLEMLETISGGGAL